MTSFEELDEDVTLSIFKYLSIKERVWYQLISKRVQRNLERLWLTQSVLSFAKRKTELLFCSRRSHRVFNCDVVSCRVDETYREHLIAKCRNLRVLILDIECPRTPLAKAINEHCPNIEHIGNAEQLISLLSPSRLPRLSCVNCDARQLEHAFAFASIQYLSLLTKPTTADQFQLIANNACRLRKLKALSAFDDQQLTRLSRSLVKCQSLEVWNQWHSERVDSLPPQQDIFWDGDIACNGNRLAFIRLVEKAGHHLRRLTMTSQNELSAIRTIATNCPNVRHVEFRYFEKFTCQRNVLQPLQLLTHLRSLELMIESFDDVAPFFELMTSCKKLARLRITFKVENEEQQVCHFEHLLAMFENYARTRPRRTLSVVVWFFNMHQTASQRNKRPLLDRLQLRTSTAPNLRLLLK